MVPDLLDKVILKTDALPLAMGVAPFFSDLIHDESIKRNYQHPFGACGFLAVMAEASDGEACLQSSLHSW